jgi:hypothetical protein
MVETKANAVSKTSKEQLVAYIKKVWSDIPEETMRASCLSIHKRLSKVIQAKGGHFE